MKTYFSSRTQHSLQLVGAVMLVFALGFFGAPTSAFCQDAYNMAPPVNSVEAPPPSNSGTESVFNWHEVPANQDVPIDRAVFDEGGYQLYDNVGETIVIPFTNDNLYVMKFAVSHTGSIYFVNSGTEPILYVPRNGYLENAAVEGARWYPFTNDFAPTTPVFLGCAPSWSVFVDTGWYPGMDCYGGYWCGTSFGYFGPSFGLFLSFGGRGFDGWGPYRGYLGYHPAPYHMGFYNHNIYHEASRDFGAGRSFRGAGGYGYAGHEVAAERSFGGAFAHSSSGGHVFRGADGYSVHGYSGGYHGFGGNGGFGADSFRGGNAGGSYRSFSSGSFRGSDAESHSFGGGFSGGGHGFGAGGFRGGGGGGFHGGGGGGHHR
jgi:hypothetical protein